MPHLPRTVTVVFVATSAVVLAALPGPSASGDALPAQPYGAFEQLDSPTGGYVHFRGWAVDPADPGGSVTVLLTNGPKTVGMAVADDYRPDAGAAVDGYGDWHGFEGLTTGWPYLSPGTSTLCARIASSGIGLGCKEVTVAPDTTPPDTLLAAVPPARSTDTRVSAEFTASETGILRFECRWDDAAATWCTSPATTTLGPGRHTFSVFAVDHAGNADLTPATTSFVIDRLPLDVAVAAVRARSRVRVDLGPDSADHDYRFRVQRRIDRTWRTVRRTTTRGTNDVRVLDLDRGRYRVVVPDQRGMSGSSVRVRLRR